MITIEVFEIPGAQSQEGQEESSKDSGGRVVGEVRLIGWEFDKGDEQVVLRKSDRTSIEAEEELLPVAKSIESEFLDHYENSNIIPLGGNMEKFYWLLKD